MITNYKDLNVWQDAMQLVEMVYQVCALLPAEEKFGLSSQLRRAAVSIPSNIAEGSRRNTNKDFVHFLAMASGSTAEVETQLNILVRINYCETSNVCDALDLCDKIIRSLSKLQQARS